MIWVRSDSTLLEKVFTLSQGPLIDMNALLKVEEHVADAQAKGAAVIAGGARHDLGGTFYQPTVLTGVTTEYVMQTAKIAQVAAVVLVRGKTPPEEMVTLARRYKIPLLLTDYSLFVACGRLYMNGIRGLDGSW